MKITILTITFAALTTAFASASDKFGQLTLDKTTRSIFDLKPVPPSDDGPRPLQPTSPKPIKFPPKGPVIPDDLPNPRPGCGGPNHFTNQSTLTR